MLLRGRDVAGQAHTGTGKTAAFLVTVISRLLSMPDRKTGLPQAIIALLQRVLRSAGLGIRVTPGDVTHHGGAALGLIRQAQAELVRMPPVSVTASPRSPSAMPCPRPEPPSCRQDLLARRPRRGRGHLRRGAFERSGQRGAGNR